MERSPWALNTLQNFPKAHPPRSLGLPKRAASFASAIQSQRDDML